MKNRSSRLRTFLLLGGVLYLCGLSFIVGRSSAEIGKPTVHMTHQMNELDRLQQETAKQK
ncbi:hypothetical protein H7849_14765 [Alloacidobacterium dinghuense]|uniref:Uncharacterized protein n=1 Tax=Alloacidobacterium dinghuense TaxID=2763107 RepID=A0A7G8BD03_9BACT|nr:hypothetical protein [Alloacidobacterium dinghuense]QNI30423.1 hypothetical protein H7849_14765 [Alloacidobacterium dinghuense]